MSRGIAPCSSHGRANVASRVSWPHARANVASRVSLRHESRPQGGARLGVFGFKDGGFNCVESPCGLEATKASSYCAKIAPRQGGRVVSGRPTLEGRLARVCQCWPMPAKNATLHSRIARLFGPGATAGRPRLHRDSQSGNPLAVRRSRGDSGLSSTTVGEIGLSGAKFKQMSKTHRRAQNRTKRVGLGSSVAP